MRVWVWTNNMCDPRFLIGFVLLPLGGTDSFPMIFENIFFDWSRFRSILFAVVFWEGFPWMDAAFAPFRLQSFVENLLVDECSIYTISFAVECWEFESRWMSAHHFVCRGILRMFSLNGCSSSTISFAVVFWESFPWMDAVIAPFHLQWILRVFDRWMQYLHHLICSGIWECLFMDAVIAPFHLQWILRVFWSMDAVSTPSHLQWYFENLLVGKLC